MTSSRAFTRPPNLEERLSAAAFSILTDNHHHSDDALRWAADTLRDAAKGETTSFQRHLRVARAHAFAQET